MDTLHEPENLLGTFRRFGLFGPVYQIVDIIRKLDNGDALMRVRLPETGEETEYRYSKILEDPREA